MIRRLIIVARDEVDLYDYIRRDQIADDTVMVISDRRTFTRRQRIEPRLPERRRTERRLHDIGPLLLTRGWAEVRVSEG
jgi:hypothetical protein